MHSLVKRDREIKKLRFEKRLKYQVIGDKFGITQERVRQICDNRPINKEDLLLKVANQYVKKFKGKINAKELLEDISLFSKPDRTKATVIKRDALIAYLYDELDFSFLEIARLLNRDHTTIVHSYRKDNE